MNIIFKNKHPELSRAKAKSFWHGEFKQSLLKLTIISTLLVGVLGLIFAGQEFAWFLVVSSITYVFFEWLSNYVMAEQGSFAGSSDAQLDLNTALSADILGHLKDPYSFAGIWSAAKESPRAIFMINRFELPLFMFEREANDDKVAERVWQEAFRLAQVSGKTRITGGEVLVALVSQIPSSQQILAQSHIEYADLVGGLSWLHHVIDLQSKFSSHSFVGGIARDWTAGYTPLLSKLGLNISAQIQNGGGYVSRDIDSHSQTIDQLVRALDASSGASVALIGDLGVGKTTTVYAFADRLLSDKSIPQSILFDQVFLIDATTLIANQNVFGGLENLLIALINEANKAKNIILFFDNAEAFFRNDTGAVDIRGVLQPIMEQGVIRIIFAMTPHDWQKINKDNESISGSINRVVMQAPPQEEVIRIMENQAILIEGRLKVTFSYQSLVEAYRLAGHYIQEGEFPGKATQLLESAAQFAEDKYVTAESVQKSIESMTGVKVQATTSAEKTELLNLEDKIHERMINQTRAVKVVSDALRRARSGVNNPNRPIGTFMFMGPTGVGKTELAKAIASTFFGGEENIVRVDMNEYISAESANRLIEPSDSGGTGLIPQIRRQPFSVVLFDEIEKADPKVLDLFLQMLDEGVLRDKDNKEVSFKDAVIIATSNAAAAEIQKLIADGKKLEDIEEEFVSNLISSGIFKPEFLNRFDEIVLFRPLTKEELLQVVDIIMASVNNNLARQKASVTLDDDAKRWLVEKGYDERLGARPLRRVVQRSVENIVAKKILESTFQPGDELHLTVQDLEQEVV
jgi:ATP-dependent Clp protease ATP-binding subunit ClpA